MADWISSLATMFRIEAGAAEFGSWRRWIALMVSPLCYFLLLAVGMASAVGGGAEYLRFVLPGVAAMQASSGLNRVVARLVAERRWGLAALKLHSGVPGSAYLLGSFAPHLLIVAAQAGVLGLVAAALGAARLVEIPLLVLLSLPAALFWTGFGYCLTAVIKSYQTRDLVLSVIVLPVSFAAPVFYDLAAAPTALRALGTVNPMTYLVELARDGLAGRVEPTTAGVVVVCLAAVLGACLSSTRRMRILSFEG